MGNTTEDTELQTELQEVYMQATHWLHDISFLKTETHFFRNIINRYQTSAGDGSHTGMFEAKITGQEQSLAALLAKIPVFLEFLKPYVEDREKEINLDFLTRYNNLKDELDALFNSIRTTKNELFKYTESIMPSLNSSKAN